MEKEKSKKESKVLSILLGVVLIVIGFGIGYVVGSYLFEESDEKTSKEKEEPFKEVSIWTQDSEIASKTEEEKLEYYFTYREPMTKEEFAKTLETGTSNEVIVRNDIKEFFAYMNGEIEAYSDGVVLMGVNEFDFVGKDIISFKDVLILECVYDMNFVDIPDYIGGHKIISSADYEKMKEYFVNVRKLQPYDDWFAERHDEDATSSEAYKTDELYKKLYDTAKKYVNQDYYVAYEYGDGYGDGGLYFEVKDIIKKSETLYDVSFNIYQSVLDDNMEKEINSKEAEGSFQVEVVNGHLKYHPSTITAVE